MYFCNVKLCGYTNIHCNMEFKRQNSIEKLVAYKHSHLVKVVTGLRRVGKSYLLLKLYRDYLIENGVKEDHIIDFQLDDFANKQYRNPENIYNYVKTRTSADKDMYYVIIDEVQLLDDFVDVLNGFLHIGNVDLYVTGSNAKSLSSDIVTEFRGRGVQIHINPLSLKEIVAETGYDIQSSWKDYMFYGGIPIIVLENDKEIKAELLRNLVKETYLNDIINRYDIKNDAELEELLKILASNIGSLTNPTKLSNTFKSEKHVDIHSTTIKNYIDYFIDAFLINKSIRYDIKGRKYIDTPCKYYFSDIGLRNSLLDFRQIEPTHIMENIIYNHYLQHGYNVDVGVVEKYSKNSDGKTVRNIYEVDFVCEKAGDRVYVQSAYSIADNEKLEQELRSMRMIDDSFRKIIVTNDNVPSHYFNNGIFVINVCELLMT